MSKNLKETGVKDGDSESSMRQAESAGKFIERVLKLTAASILVLIVWGTIKVQRNGLYGPQEVRDARLNDALNSGILNENKIREIYTTKSIPDQMEMLSKLEALETTLQSQ